MSSLLPSLPRRSLLASGAATAATAGALTAVDLSPASGAAGRRYFAHGVASGDPMPDRVVIWTRVTPTGKARAGSGHGPDVQVGWEVSTDPRFRKVVREGRVRTGADRDHTVKLDVTKLKPARWYYYRFTFRGTHSRVGRFRTAPAKSASPGNLRLGVVSCANLQAGWFSAYRGLARRNDLHAVLCLGDYLYEYGPGQYGYGSNDRDIRRHSPAHEIVSLRDYRQRHAQYKRDTDLQDLHARYPWIVTWDDHETANDAYLQGAENHNPGEGGWEARKRRAHRAYDEWMPVRLDDTAKVDDGTRIYRRLQFGTLAELSMLDLRSYRSKQVALTKTQQIASPARTITGRAQLRWLLRSLIRRRTTWTVIGNPVMISPVSFAHLPEKLFGAVNDVTGLLPPEGIPYNPDQWDGYTADRRQVLSTIKKHGVRNPLFVTGDIHSAWACELPYDTGSYPLSGSAGVEFVCSSVTSSNLKDILGTPRRTASVAVETAIKTANLHVKHLNFDDHGFCVLDLTRNRAQCDWFIIGDRAVRDTPITWQASFATLAGSHRVRRVAAPVR